MPASSCNRRGEMKGWAYCTALACYFQATTRKPRLQASKSECDEELKKKALDKNVLELHLYISERDVDGKRKTCYRSSACVGQAEGGKGKRLAWRATKIVEARQQRIGNGVTRKKKYTKSPTRLVSLMTARSIPDGRVAAHFLCRKREKSCRLADSEIRRCLSQAEAGRRAVPSIGACFVFYLIYFSFLSFFIIFHVGRPSCRFDHFAAQSTHTFGWTRQPAFAFVRFSLLGRLQWALPREGWMGHLLVSLRTFTAAICGSLLLLYSKNVGLVGGWSSAYPKDRMWHTDSHISSAQA